MYIWFKIAWAVIAAILILLILLHSPKGDGLGGIGGQAQLFSSTKSAETTLNRLTWTLTVMFLSLTVALSAGLIAPPTTATPSAQPAPTALPKTNPTDLPSGK
ncbi:preprotein translocase subunit SecG [Pseudanabaena sp. PCC 6802]|uniref:preprotein translocase subunit SecG n=1 Tax=Pseudanabaena sp. PCC 6802 TaxID=118173 RepID=UPI00037CA9B0|nr:preprotein translocase subunit SecG [Pseudanabaena sp. PCC 6802]